MVDGTREFILVQALESSNNPASSPGRCSADLCIDVCRREVVRSSCLLPFDVPSPPLYRGRVPSSLKQPRPIRPRVSYSVTISITTRLPWETRKD